MASLIPEVMGPIFLMLLVAADIWHGSASPIISPNLSMMTVNTGDPVKLLCSGNSSVEWVGVTNDTDVIVYPNGTLYIPSANCRTMGNYQCGYINNTDVETISIYLLVRDRKSPWCVPTKTVSVREGDDALLPCLMTDPEFAGNVTLVRDYVQISSEFSFSALHGILLHKVSKSDGNRVYQCRALVQGQWKESNEIMLNFKAEITELISVNMVTKDDLRIQGEPFNITCRINSHTHDYRYKWSYPSTANLPVALIKQKDYDWNSNTYFAFLTLSIPAVQLGDSGKYICTGYNSAGSRNASVLLQVIERGFVHLFTKQNTSCETRLGEQVKLQVFIQAYPKPHIWRWTAMNSPVLSNNFINSQMSNNRYISILILNWKKGMNSGTYTFYAENDAANASISFNIFVKRLPKASLRANDSSSLSCEATGYPAPRIEWYKLPNQSHVNRCYQGGILLMNDTRPQIVHTTPFGAAIVKSIFPVEKTNNVTFCCLAVNDEGNFSVTHTTVITLGATRVFQNKISTSVITSCVGTMVFLLLCIIFLLYKYKQKPKYQVHWKIIEAHEGNHYTFIDPTQLPYNEKWEFPRNNLQFGKTLGAGAFGKVIEATAFGLGKEDSVLKVAVKMLKSTAHIDEQEALMSELKIMSHLGHHENIVNLLGACTHGGPVLVITEYCPHGDLLNFLRRKAEYLISQELALESSLDSTASDYKNIYLGKKCVRSDSGFGSQCVESYFEMRPVATSISMPTKDRSSESEDEKEVNHPLDLNDLLLFSSQVAQGMTFLAAKNCIHRDLAARNVLVADGGVAKICDFGLARDIMNDSNYVVKGNARLPVKWMAPESIFECVYTVQSDVWSYGILLWEIFTLGRSPYPDMKVNSKFYSLVKQGYHMARPDFAPDEMYNIMKACWNLEPTQRPAFNQICTFIQKQLDGSKAQDYANLAGSTEDSICDEESCDAGESRQPLLHANNYQFC